MEANENFKSGLNSVRKESITKELQQYFNILKDDIKLYIEKNNDGYNKIYNEIRAVEQCKHRPLSMYGFQQYLRKKELLYLLMRKIYIIQPVWVLLQRSIMKNFSN